MREYVVKRLLLSIPVLFGASVLVFAMIRLIPGCPAVAMAGVHADAEFIEQVRQDLGLDRSLPAQYVMFLGDLLRGELGRSTLSGRPVIRELAERFPRTGELTLTSMGVATAVGVAAGIISSTRPYSTLDNLSMIVALAGVAMPVFWLGLMLQLLFSVELGWLPATGRGTAAHLILPALALGAVSAGIVARMTRSSMLEVLKQDFIVTARSKGLAERVVVYRHALKNAMIPVVTIVGLQFGTLLGGAVLTETVFAWPGLGRLLVGAILARDYPVIQGGVLLLSTTFVVVNLGVDLFYVYLDPRIRYVSRAGES